MTDQEEPAGTSEGEDADEARQVAGEREQGVRSEDSEDLSSPRLTERRDG